MKAVATLLAHSSTAWSMLKCPSGIQPNTTAAMEARNPTTVAWTWEWGAEAQQGTTAVPGRGERLQ